ncbi:MAG: ATP-binding cassette domain-containing protein, partial [Gammaproteobacteria bacterium]
MPLEGRGIQLHVSGFDLLRDVDLVVQPGTVTAIVGPNGAGKSSLLRVLCGELLPTRGEVLLNGRALGAWEADRRARMLSVLPQHAVLDFPFTAREVVSLGRTPHDTGADRDREIVRAALEAVDAA